MNNDKIIMYDSDEAAMPCKLTVEVEGKAPIISHQWLASDGVILKDEDSARYRGCTHRACPECGKPAAKEACSCPECAAENWERDVERVNYADIGDAMFFWWSEDRFFEEVDEVYDYIACDLYMDEDFDLQGFEKLLDTDFRVCKLKQFREIVPEEHYDLPEDYDLPKDVQSAWEAANKSMDNVKLWKPTNILLVFNEDIKKEFIACAVQSIEDVKNANIKKD